MKKQKRMPASIKMITSLSLSAITAITLSQSGNALTLVEEETLLLRQPAISEDFIAFVYAGDLWTADKDGNDATRLTSHPAEEGRPFISPDGEWIAFNANYGGNTDVYIIPSIGGQPKRLTWHPGTDTVQGWSNDGSKVLFTSRREIDYGRTGQLYSVSVGGGAASRYMDAAVFNARFTSDGKKLAYLPFGPAYNGLYGGSSGWRQYRGGRVPYINIMDTSSGKISTLDGAGANNINPMWVGNTLYFLSDKDGKAINLYRQSDDGSAQKITNEQVWDIRWADTSGQEIIFETGGKLKHLDTATGEISAVPVLIRPDLPQLRAQWKDASKNLESGVISPTGKRVLLTARGDIFTVPVKDGSTRNLTNSGDERESSALWSPESDKIAYISDRGGKHTLVITDQTGTNTEQSIALGGTSYYSLLDWVQGGDRIVYSDNHLNLYTVSLKSKKITKIATSARRNSLGPEDADFSVASSPDGEWLAYTVRPANFNSNIMLYNFEDGQSHRVTDGLANATSPAFSKDGKYLYFAAATNIGQAQVGLDMSSQEQPIRNALYAVVLSNKDTSPVFPKSGDEINENENGNNKKDKKPEKQASKTVIDLDGLADRIVALPLPSRNFGNLIAAADGNLYFTEKSQAGDQDLVPGKPDPSSSKLMRFDFKEQKLEEMSKGVERAILSADGKYFLLLKPNNKIQTAKVDKKLKLKSLSLKDVRTYIEPRKEWAQILQDTWRMEREYFYDGNMHGLDWDSVYARYKPLVGHVGRREDLNQLIVEMIAEMQVGHNRAGGGDIHQEKNIDVGLLGANFKTDGSYYRFDTIYDGESWNPYLKAPLSQPGQTVTIGDYLLAVNGQKVTANDNLFQYLEGTTGKQVTLTIGSSPNLEKARDITVEPIRSEFLLRLWRWVENNRKQVEKATGGRVGYVYLPNTAGPGYTFFNRMFFAQTDKDAVIIDERSNGGGQAANYITDVLSRTYLAGWKDRAGLVFNTPGGAVHGPKVMLIDQDAGSGGDFLPYSFRHMKIGQLIGKRTWGGLIGISANPNFVDGGRLTVPYFRFFDPDGNWTIENEGVSPDIDVALDPNGVNEGRDTQLEKAVDVILEQLKGYKPIAPKEAPPVPTVLGK